jgi:hypothetical protein
LEGTTVRLAAEGALLAAVTDTGALFVSNDSGENFRRAAACAAGRGLSDVVVERGIMWGLTVEGTLFRSDDYGASWGSVTALTKVLRIALHPALGVIAVTPAGVLAVGAEPFASVLGAPGGGLWSAADGIGDVTAMAFLDDAGALLVAMHRDAEDVTWLVRLPARAAPGVALASASGSIDAARPEVVAEVGALAIRALDRDRARAQEDELLDGAATAMARDDAHGVLWVSGGFGLFAYEPS